MTNFMKKLVVAVLVIAMCLSAFAGCGKKASDVFIFGGIGPTTGDYATYGLSVRNGAQLAVDEINAAGGINGFQVEFKMEDSEGASENAINVANKLIDGGMHALVGPTLSGETYAVSAETNEAGVFQMTPSGSALNCTEKDNAFRTCFTDPLQGASLAKFFNTGYADQANVGILYKADDDYSTGIYKAFEADVNAECVVQSFTSEQSTDFSTQINTFKSEGVQSVLLPIYAADAVKFLDQAVKAGLDVFFFGGDGIDGIHSEDGVKPETINGVVYLSGFSATAPAANVQAFVTAYAKANPEKPVDQFAAAAYDTVYAFKAAMEKGEVTPDMDPVDVNEVLKKTMTEVSVNGVTGAMTWNAQGEPTKDAFYIEIVDGQPAPKA